MRIPAPRVGTLISAGTIALCAPPIEWVWLSWIALIPWFWSLSRLASRKEALFQALWFGVLYQLAMFHWVMSGLRAYHDLSWGVSILIFLGWSVFAQLPFVALALLVQQARDFRFPRALATAAAFVGLEWLWGKTLHDTLGELLWASPNFRQIADIGGPEVLTVLIITIGLLALGIRRSPKNLILIASILLLDWGYGEIRIRQVRQFVSAAPRVLHAAVIQSNIGNHAKLISERGEGATMALVLKTHFDLTDQALKSRPAPDFVVWPESAFPMILRPGQMGPVEPVLDRYLRTMSVPLLTGSYDEVGSVRYNAIFLLRGGIHHPDVYWKRRLLPMGEVIPAGLEIGHWKFPAVTRFGEGQLNSPMRLTSPSGEVRIAPMICYESLFPKDSVAMARRGVDLLLNLTNDSWFGHLGEQRAHLAKAVFRAIETRLPLLRAATTGVSAFILPDGSMPASTSPDTATVMNVTIPLSTPLPTLRVLWGDWFGPACLLLAFLTFKKLVKRVDKRV
ncbi:MAG: apolipoprotein N-acyltransferase [Bdellovibrionota bacterium]